MSVAVSVQEGVISDSPGLHLAVSDLVMLGEKLEKLLVLVDPSMNFDAVLKYLSLAKLRKHSNLHSTSINTNY